MIGSERVEARSVRLERGAGSAANLSGSDRAQGSMLRGCSRRPSPVWGGFAPFSIGTACVRSRDSANWMPRRIGRQNTPSTGALRRLGNPFWPAMGGPIPGWPTGDRASAASELGLALYGCGAATPTNSRQSRRNWPWPAGQNTDRKSCRFELVHFWIDLRYLHHWPRSRRR
jgi:hypothetical protein